ncbi:monovalent cation/H(+) antiporter subunit G [Parasphingorhabdus pacifica]
MTWLDVFSAVCLLSGAFSCLMGAIGLLTFPDVASRLQAATKPQTLGLILVLIGTATQVEVKYVSGLVLVALFQMLTSPILSQLVGRAAYRSGNARHKTLVVDDLGNRLERERRFRS